MKQSDISLIEQDLAAPERLAKVRQWLLEYAGCTLLQFAYLVCMRFRLVNEAGKLRDHTCARALEELDRKGLICLADSLKLKAPVKKAPAPESGSGEEPAPPPKDVPDSVEKIREIRIVKAVTKEQKALAFKLLRDEHPNGDEVPPGPRETYLIYTEHGLVGVAVFTGAPKKCGPLNAWMGWSNAQKDTYINCVINMARLLVRPCVKCKNLASKLISLLEARVPGDYMMDHRLHLCVLVTFVDSETHSGASCKAAGWDGIGKTLGRGWRGEKIRVKGETPTSPKLVFVRTIDPNFRSRLGLPGLRWCTAPDWYRKGALSLHDGLSEGVQAFFGREFEASPLGNEKRNKRAAKIMKMLCDMPPAVISKAGGGAKKDTKGAYRFCEVEDARVSMETILAGHRECTCRRMMEQEIVCIC